MSGSAEYLPIPDRMRAVEIGFSQIGRAIFRHVLLPGVQPVEAIEAHLAKRADAADLAGIHPDPEALSLGLQQHVDPRYKLKPWMQRQVARNPFLPIGVSLIDIVPAPNRVDNTEVRNPQPDNTNQPRLF